MTITKEFKFEMAHKLSFSYTKKCQHIHGHSYRLKVVLLSDLEEPATSEGVLLDYTLLKEMVEPTIKLLDHNFMIHKDDKCAWGLIKKAKEGHFPLLVCEHNPTAERLAIMFAHTIGNQLFIRGFSGFVHSIRCLVYETATSEAEYELSLQDINRDKQFHMACQVI